MTANFTYTRVTGAQNVHQSDAPIWSQSGTQGLSRSVPCGTPVDNPTTQLRLCIVRFGSGLGLCTELCTVLCTILCIVRFVCVCVWVCTDIET